MRVAVRVVVLAFSAVIVGKNLAAQPAREALPAVDIIYPTVFDRTCSSFLVKGDVTPEMIQAAVKIKPRLQAEWSQHGTRYLATALQEIGAPFPYREVQATLTVCAVTSMSAPLLINVRKYLPGAEHPAPDENFSEALFHELMHHYVASLTTNSALKKKYASEPLVVLNHLHVIALEKMVLSKLHEADELKLVEQEYLTSRSPDYKRAWEIVSEVGPEPFLRELKDAAKK